MWKHSWLSANWVEGGVGRWCRQWNDSDDGNAPTGQRHYKHVILEQLFKAIPDSHSSLLKIFQGHWEFTMSGQLFQGGLERQFWRMPELKTRTIIAHMRTTLFAARPTFMFADFLVFILINFSQRNSFFGAIRELIAQACLRSRLVSHSNSFVISQRYLVSFRMYICYLIERGIVVLFPHSQKCVH